MVWDYESALQIIAESCSSSSSNSQQQTSTAPRAGEVGPVVAVLCGHDHKGGYHYDAATQVHHITLQSPLNRGTEGRAFGTSGIITAPSNRA